MGHRSLQYFPLLSTALHSYGGNVPETIRRTGPAFAPREEKSRSMDTPLTRGQLEADIKLIQSSIKETIRLKDIELGKSVAANGGGGGRLSTTPDSPLDESQAAIMFWDACRRLASFASFKGNPTAAPILVRIAAGEIESFTELRQVEDYNQYYVELDWEVQQALEEVEVEGLIARHLPGGFCGSESTSLDDFIALLVERSSENDRTTLQAMQKLYEAGESPAVGSAIVKLMGWAEPPTSTRTRGRLRIATTSPIRPSKCRKLGSRWRDLPEQGEGQADAEAVAIRQDAFRSNA